MAAALLGLFATTAQAAPEKPECLPAPGRTAASI